MKILKKVLLQDIIALALSISEDKENPAVVSVDFSGHVNRIGIRGYSKGYGSTPEWDFKYECYTTDKDCVSKLTKAKKYLEKLQNKRTV